MRILFDQATPVPIRAFLDRHEVFTAYHQGWSTLKNGDLLTAAEADGFQPHVQRIVDAIDSAVAGSYSEFEIPSI